MQVYSILKGVVGGVLVKESRQDKGEHDAGGRSFDQEVNLVTNQNIILFYCPVSDDLVFCLLLRMCRKVLVLLVCLLRNEASNTSLTWHPKPDCLSWIWNGGKWLCGISCYEICSQSIGQISILSMQAATGWLARVTLVSRGFPLCSLEQDGRRSLSACLCS